MSAHEFHPGNRVKVVTLAPVFNQDLIGATGEVVSTRRSPAATDIVVALDGLAGARYFTPDELERLDA